MNIVIIHITKKSVKKENMILKQRELIIYKHKNIT